MTEDKHTTTAPAAGTGTYRFVIGFCVFCKLSDRRDPKEDRFRTGLAASRKEADLIFPIFHPLKEIVGLFFTGLHNVILIIIYNSL